MPSAKRIRDEVDLICQTDTRLVTWTREESLSIRRDIGPGRGATLTRPRRSKRVQDGRVERSAPACAIDARSPLISRSLPANLQSSKMSNEKPTDTIAIQQQDYADDDIKAEVLHEEYKDAAAASEDVVQKSPFEELTFFKTITLFKKATFLALLAAFSAAADGYQVSYIYTSGM